MTTTTTATDRAERMAVATTILQQLGGSRFRAMTGAKGFVAHTDGLSFRLPSRFARNGINAVKVTLTAADDYTVEFMKIWGTKVRTVETREDVYCDNLRAIFTDATGLDTSL